LGGEIPGFGGYVYDAEGNLVAFLIDTVAHGPTARQALEALLRARPRGRHSQSAAASPRVLFRKGVYDYAQLANWRDRLTATLVTEGIGGWTMIDGDEARNRVPVGIVDEGARGPIAGRLADAQVPAAAVEFEVTGRLVPTQGYTRVQGPGNIDSYYRPLRGGQRMFMQNPNTGETGNCTGTVAARFGTAVDQYVLTNSHCTGRVTQRWEIVDGTRMFQDLFAAGDPKDRFVASEVFDPGPTTQCTFPTPPNLIPTVFNCRWADVSAARLDPQGQWAEMGTIMKTWFSDGDDEDGRWASMAR
jgi:hypothetical protein